jgi:hypothetical protein
VLHHIQAMCSTYCSLSSFINMRVDMHSLVD